nr:winged helix-turn-helix transcriptional regulator [Methanosarcina sp. KYL-1]
MLAPGGALAATVHGTVYEWYSFEPLNNAVIKVNSTPEQYFVAPDAVYSFNLPPGNYLITASYFEGGTLVYAAEETVKISEDGDYVLDILLFPPYEEELLDQSELEDIDRDFKEAELVAEEDSQNTTVIFVFLALSALLLVGYFWKERQGKTSDISPGPLNEAEMVSKPRHENPVTEAKSPEEVEIESWNFVVPEESPEPPAPEAPEEGVSGPVVSWPEPADGAEALYGVRAKPSGEELEASVIPTTAWDPKEPVKKVPCDLPDGLPDDLTNDLEVHLRDDPEAHLPDDLKEVLELIRASGNRITQRELRKKSRYSESKVSLMLSDLEERGLIEKFKKGRGNVLRITDEHIRKQAEYENKKEDCKREDGKRE